MEFSERLNLILKEKKLKQKDVSDFIGISNQSLTDWKRRGTIPAGDICLKIATFLNVSVEWLITGKEKVSESEYMSLSDEEKKLIDNFRKCSEQNKNALLMMSENLKPIC